MTRTIIALGAIALALALAGGALAGKRYLITSSSQVRNGSLSMKDLSHKAQKALKGERGRTGVQGPKGDTGDQGLKGDTGPQGPPGVSNLETDGPYPGGSIPPLNTDAAGYQSTSQWAGDGTLQQSWVVCPKDKVALGGGFGQDDVQTDQLVVVSSSPVEFKEDSSGTWNYVPIDAEGSFVPNGWLVQGYNKSGSSLVVRPWVICATVNK